MSKCPTVGISLLARNQYHTLTEPCLDALFQRTDLGARPTHVYLLDDASSDGTYEAAKQYKVSNLHVERSEQQLGIVTARNRTFRKLLDVYRCDFIIVLHNDHIVPPRIGGRDWISWLLDAIILDARRGIIGCTPLEGGREAPADFAERAENHNHQFAGTFSELENTHPCIMRATMMREIGLYDEGFGMLWFEDIDYILRAKVAGWIAGSIGDVLVWHGVRRTWPQEIDHYQAKMELSRAHMAEKWHQYDPETGYFTHEDGWSVYCGQ